MMTSFAQLLFFGFFLSSFSSPSPDSVEVALVFPSSSCIFNGVNDTLMDQISNTTVYYMPSSSEEIYMNYQVEVALRMAVSEMNNKSDGIYDDILSDTNIKVHYMLANTSNSFIDGYNLFDSRYEDMAEVIAAIFPGWTDYMMGMAPMLAEKGIVPIEYAYNGELCNSLGNGIRAFADIGIDGTLLASVVAKFNFQNVIVFYSSLHPVNLHSFLRFRSSCLDRNIRIRKAIDVNEVSRESLLVFVDECKKSKLNAFVFFLDSTESFGFFHTLLLEGDFFRKGLQFFSGSRVFSSELLQSFMLSEHQSDFFAALKGYIAIDRHCIHSDTDFVARFHDSIAGSQNVQQFSSCDQMFSSFSFITERAVNAYNAFINLAVGIEVLFNNSSTSLCEVGDQKCVLEEVMRDCAPYPLSEKSGAVVEYPVVNFDPGKEDIRNNSICPASFPFTEVIGFVSIDTGKYQTCDEHHLTTNQDKHTSFCVETVVYNTRNGKVPRDYASYTRVKVQFGVQVLCIVMCTLGMALATFCITYLMIHRLQRIVRVTQPEFSYIVLLGLIFNFSYALMTALEVQNCLYLVWVEGLSAALIEVPLVVSVWRMHMVLNRGTKRTKLTVTDAMTVTAVIIGVYLAFLCMSTAQELSKSGSLGVTTVDSSGYEYYNCDTKFGHDNVSYAIDLCYLGFRFIVVVFGILYGFVARKTPIATGIARRVMSCLLLNIVYNVLGFVLWCLHENGLMQSNIYHSLVSLSCILFGLLVMQLMFRDTIICIVQGFDLDEKFRIVRSNDDGVSLRSIISIACDYVSSIFTSAYRVFPTVEAPRSYPNCHPAHAPGGVLLLRRLSTSDTDEKYQIQAQIQKLYRRLEVINRNVLVQSNLSNSIWSENDQVTGEKGSFRGAVPTRDDNNNTNANLMRDRKLMASVMEEEHDFDSGND